MGVSPTRVSQMKRMLRQCMAATVHMPESLPINRPRPTCRHCQEAAGRYSGHEPAMARADVVARLHGLGDRHWQCAITLPIKGSSRESVGELGYKL